MTCSQHPPFTDMPEIKVDEARWDARLATDEAQALLERLADEALAEFRIGQNRPMAFSDDGRIVPGSDRR